LMGIFAVSALFEIIATILDYQMKVLGKASHHSTADFAAFMGFFGQAANSVSLVFSLLGTSFVIRTFGVRITLMLFPAMLIVAVRVVYSAPSMWVLFGVMVSIKGLAYALNNPSKEVRRRMQHASAGSSERDCAALVAHPLIRTSPRGTSLLHKLHRALF
jgi:AAA family ATP:ADP antiporter